ncbi:nucleolar transcription factor 1-A-like isoform X2 [Limulus polyphemus]|uniref:Nucleolar transcription factor 1-A-like isoform X2 n=1 Tax=Limulus polyphemus TaxID=6850 RepID=A0ABM1BFZ2_LIMPO|nr:nucleolar transcription factor 1-A-like isoform X2 [Limulus polyphemus]
MASVATSPQTGSSRRKGGKRPPTESTNGPITEMKTEASNPKKLKPEEDTTSVKVKKEIAEPTPKHSKKKETGTTNEEESTQANKENQSSRNTLVFDWTSEDLSQLINNLTNCLPKTDNVRYNTLVEKLDWDKVCFGSYTGVQCKEKWMQIMTRLRRYRTLTDMVTDAKEWVKHPWSSFSTSKKQKHPEMPKKPLTPYFRYFLEKREKYSHEHPEMSMTDLAKLLSKKFQQLPEKKKLKYKESYERENEVYKQDLEKFKKEHPDEFPLNESKHHPSGHTGPEKPHTPFNLFLADRTKRSEYAGLEKKDSLEKARKQWNALSDGKRIKWIRKAVQDEQRFSEDIAGYLQSHPDFKPNPLKNVLSKAEKELKDRYDGKPERPPNSGYSLFSRIMLREIKDVPSKEKMAEISKRWKLLTDAQRESHNKQARKANAKYKEKYAAYLNSLSEEERQRVLSENKTPKKKNLEGTPNGNIAKGKTVNAVATVDDKDDKLKKPETPLAFYQQEKLQSAKTKNPEMSKQDLLKQLTKEFQELSEKKKEKYKRMAEEAKKLPPETNGVKGKEAGHEQPISKKGLFKGEPKKPPQSGYAVFSSEMLSILTEVDPKNRMAEIAKRWKAMSNVEKEKYKKRSQDLMKKYNKELQKFLNGLTPAEREAYDQVRSKKGKADNKYAQLCKTVKPQPQTGKDIATKKEESESESSDDDEESSSEDDNDDDQEEQSGDSDDSDSGSEESGSDSDDDEDDDDDSDEDENDGEAKKEGNEDSSSEDSDSDSESGSGTSEDSSGSGSESEKE